MNKQTIQELLPPLRSSASEPSWFDWLTDPMPKRFLLPATGLLIIGLDWLLFSEEAASFGLLIPFTSLVGFIAGGIGNAPRPGFQAIGHAQRTAGRFSCRHPLSARRHPDRRHDPSQFWLGRSEVASTEKPLLTPRSSRRRAIVAVPPPSASAVPHKVSAYLLASLQAHSAEPVDPAELVAGVVALTRRTGKTPLSEAAISRMQARLICVARRSGLGLVGRQSFGCTGRDCISFQYTIRDRLRTGISAGRNAAGG